MAAPTLIELAPGCLYLPGAVNVGVVANRAGEALLLDTGGDKEAGRTLRKALDEAGLRAVAIVNSHSHADHYGGNDFLARNLALPVWAPELEEAILRYPYLEPMYLFGGAAPLVGLRNKWLEGKASPVDHIFAAEEGPLAVAGFTLQRHATNGHAMRQVAFGVGSVCYAADAFFGAEVLAKYEIPFTHDVGGQLESLRRLPTLPYAWFLPGHGQPTQQIAEAVAANEAAIQRTVGWVREAVSGGGATTSEVVHGVTARLSAPPSTLPTYFLMHACVLAYLSHLTAEGLLHPMVERGTLRWHPA